MLKYASLILAVIFTIATPALAATTTHTTSPATSSSTNTSSTTTSTTTTSGTGVTRGPQPYDFVLPPPLRPYTTSPTPLNLQE